jgi:hypothetical protein
MLQKSTVRSLGTAETIRYLIEIICRSSGHRRIHFWTPSANSPQHCGRGAEGLPSVTEDLLSRTALFWDTSPCDHFLHVSRTYPLPPRLSALNWHEVPVWDEADGQLGARYPHPNASFWGCGGRGRRLGRARIGAESEWDSVIRTKTRPPLDAGNRKTPRLIRIGAIYGPYRA